MEYTIAQVSKKTNLSAYTLRYYDKEGLFPSILRNKAGNRIFTDDDLEMISIICCLKETGMPIKQIKRFVDWQNEGDKTLQDRNDMLQQHKEAVLQYIDAFQKNLRLINRKLDYYKDACSAYDSGEPIPSCCSYPLEDLE